MSESDCSDAGGTTDGNCAAGIICALFWRIVAYLSFLNFHFRLWRVLQLHTFYLWLHGVKKLHLSSGMENIMNYFNTK